MILQQIELLDFQTENYWLLLTWTEIILLVLVLLQNSQIVIAVRIFQ